MNQSPEYRAGSEVALKRYSLRLDGDGYIAWDETSKLFPRNWTFWKKSYNTFYISSLELLVTAISSAGTSASTTGRKQYGYGETLGYFAFLSIYLIGQTLGGIVCPPLSEIFGRRELYIIGALAYCVFCAITGSIDSIIAVYFGRFFSGFSSAIPATVAFGSLEDMYDAEKRIWAVFAYTWMGFVGLALGPIYGAYITETAGWRWVFYIATMIAGGFAVFALGLSETRPKPLLSRQLKQFQEATGDNSLRVYSEKSQHPFTDFLNSGLIRPLWFTITEPLVTLCTLLCSIAFGLIYGLTESITIVYMAPPFNFSETSSSLPFIAILLGICLDVLPRFYDQRVFRLYQKWHRPLEPEAKVTSIAISCPALAAGLWIFAWSIGPDITDVHWILSMIGLVLVGFAISDLSYILFGYITDSYGTYAASATASLSLGRTLTAAAFPLFTTQMYEGLGANVATTILASVATVFCITPVVVLKYGKWFRSKSKWANNDISGSDERQDGQKTASSSKDELASFGSRQSHPGCAELEKGV